VSLFKLLHPSFHMQNVCSGVPEHVHILGERELNVLYYCLMNVTMNAFILVSVNARSLSFTSYNRVADFYRAFQAKTRLKHT